MFMGLITTKGQVNVFLETMKSSGMSKEQGTKTID